MKLKIRAESFIEKQNVEEKRALEPIDFALQLKTDEDGDAVLQAVDPETGKKIDGGNILFISSDGFIGVIPRINPRLGFDLDESGFVKVRKPALPMSLFGDLMERLSEKNRLE